MLFSADQFVAHAIGDYVLQSDWMANEKTKKSIAALAHVVLYGLPFLFFQPSLVAMAVIVGTHFVIDRWRLARYVCWAKNFLSPPKYGLKSIGDMESSSIHSPVRYWHPWSECSGTGYHKDRPPWMAVWLMIIVDNLMHVTINALALRYL